MLEGNVLRAASVYALTVATLSLGQSCTPDILSQYPSGWPQKLDAGIYWFGTGNQFVKAVDGEKSALYDPKRPTVIYFHGWTGNIRGGWTSECKRMTTQCSESMCRDMANADMAEAWYEKGWNVGFFYWDQFADEACIRDAEQKIWFDKAGDGLSWKSYDVSTGVFSVKEYNMTSSASVADICVESAWKALGSYSGPHVRFVGHSIGAQLAARCASKLHYANHPAAPQRLALLEPFFSKTFTNLDPRSFWLKCRKQTAQQQTGEDEDTVGTFTAEATSALVETLWEKKKVVTEVYKSSLLTEKPLFGTVNEKLQALATFVQYHPEWCGGTESTTPLQQMLTGVIGESVEATEQDYACRHLAMIPMYFLGLGLPPRPLDQGAPVPAYFSPDGAALKNCSTPSAACTDDAEREWVQQQLDQNGAQKWEQVGGVASCDPSDDTFRLAPFPLQNSLVVEQDAYQLYGTDSQPPKDWWTKKMEPVGGKFLPEWMPQWLPAAVLAGLFGTCCICCMSYGAIHAFELLSEADTDEEFGSSDGSGAGSDLRIEKDTGC
eukprot:TRINITY_DN41802_c0_g1_i1.p1 TRINITY_DN41802_c0_g1~~TRINITY_DN41802_c0_g1_i1.p1  ORF type:complete len:550 (-),score=106.97 TRINITY_DN41802_c0_g1_i1:251-1900(-)